MTLPPSPRGNTLRWLHLSDFHTGRDEHGQSNLFGYILKHLDQRAEQHGPPDFVFITGDVAQSARPEQYEKFAEEFLLALEEKVGKGRILMVPGNHDVDRNQQEFVTRAAIRSAAMTLAGFGLACRELFRAYNTPVFMAGCGAASDLGLRLRHLNTRDKRYFSDHQKDAREAGVEEVDSATAIKRIRPPPSPPTASGRGSCRSGCNRRRSLPSRA